MVKIVNNQLYNTDKSDLIFTDYDKRRQYYMTDKGHFFVVYNNGELKPTTEETIKMILGQKDVEKYIEIFGEPQEA